MEILATAIMALAVGLAFGLKMKNPKQVEVKKSPRSLDDKLKPVRHIDELSGFSIYFDILEVRFIKRLIDNENSVLTVFETNEILRIEKLSKENQRQRRHLFLKELNMKLKMIFKINDCIERQSTEFDRRSKLYSLNQNLDPKTLIQLIEINS